MHLAPPPAPLSRQPGWGHVQILKMCILLQQRRDLTAEDAFAARKCEIKSGGRLGANSFLRRHQSFWNSLSTPLRRERSLLCLVLEAYVSTLKLSSLSKVAQAGLLGCTPSASQHNSVMTSCRNKFQRDLIAFLISAILSLESVVLEFKTIRMIANPVAYRQPNMCHSDINRKSELR